MLRAGHGTYAQSGHVLASGKLKVLLMYSCNNAYFSPWTRISVSPSRKYGANGEAIARNEGWRMAVKSSHSFLS